MSLPNKPWADRDIGRLYNKSVEMMKRAVDRKDDRLLKRSERLAERAFALWFQAKDIDPNGLASITDPGYGTRKHP